MLQYIPLVNRLNVSQRFLASVCFFSLPLGVLFYFNMDQLPQKIAFAEQELAGNRFQAPAVRLLKALSDYQLATATAESKANLDATSQQVDELMTVLQKANDELGPRLQF